MLINHALSTETQKFNAELKQAAETGQLQHADLFNNYSNRHLQLISTVKFANEKLSMLATPNLMLFVICHFANVFTMRSFGDHFDLHQKILCINFLLASLFALLITIKKPAAVNNEVIFLSVHYIPRLDQRNKESRPSRAINMERRGFEIKQCRTLDCRQNKESRYLYSYFRRICN
jgi:hypothetical protein